MNKECAFSKPRRCGMADHGCGVRSALVLAVVGLSNAGRDGGSDVQCLHKARRWRLERLRHDFLSLGAVDQIWFADTASFDDKREWVDFSRRAGGSMVESFAFYQGKLESMSRDGMPIFIPASAD